MKSNSFNPANGSSSEENMRVAYTFPKNRFDEVWVYVQPFMDRDFVHIRVFKLGNDDEMRRTSKGIAVDVKDVYELRNGIDAVIQTLEAGLTRPSANDDEEEDLLAA